jgi:hypothetical protein
MATPLELSYQWQTPAIGATAGAAVCIAVLASSHVDGWLPVAGIVVVVWAGFLASVLLRTRAYLMVDGSRLTVRRYRNLHTIEAEQLTAVSEFITSRRGPSYRLTVRDAEGRKHRYIAPTALLRGGHSTLFRWILTRAPQAELDRGSRRTIERLQIRGLLR